MTLTGGAFTTAILDIEPDGSTSRRGVATGRLTATEYAARDGILIVHEEGHHYWQSMIHPSAYARARWHVYQVVTGEAHRDGSTTIVVDHIIDFETSTSEGQREEAGGRTADRLHRHQAEQADDNEGKER